MSKETANPPYERSQKETKRVKKPANFGKIHLVKTPRCGAKRRRREELCKAPAMANGRCRIHGGTSTGARTEEGKARARQGNLKHGYYTQEAIEQRRQDRKLLKQLRDDLKGLF